MENRLRNESAFYELLVEIEKRLSSHLSSTTSDLRNHYRNTNPHYLFSDKFHELIITSTETLKRNKNYNVQKCIKKLTQELTFYKIACPMKHLRLAELNVPHLIATSDCDRNEDLFPVDETKKKIVEDEPSGISSNEMHGANRNSENGSPKALDSGVPGIQSKIEEAILSVHKSSTLVVNIKKCQQGLVDEVVTASKTQNNCYSTSKRKMTEAIAVKEEEISRKKTSNGQKVERNRTSHENGGGSPKLSENALADVIFIPDDDDENKMNKNNAVEDVVVNRSCNLEKINGLKNNVVPSKIICDFSHLQKITKTITDAKRNLSNGSGPDEDVFIVEDVDEAGPERAALSQKKKISASKVCRDDADDVIMIDAFNRKHKKTFAKHSNAKRKDEDNNDDCFISHTSS